MPKRMAGGKMAAGAAKKAMPAMPAVVAKGRKRGKGPKMASPAPRVATSDRY